MCTCGDKLVGKRAHRPWLGRAAVLLSMPLALALLAGCPPAHQQHIQQGGDPLLGEEYRKGANPINPKTTQARAPDPINSALESAQSNAAVATGVLPDSRPLAIPNANGQFTGQTKTNPSPWSAGGDGGLQPTLRRPIPVEGPQSKLRPQQTDPQVVPAMMVGSQPTQPADSAPSLEALQAELKKRGVVWQREQKVADGVRLVCAFPNPQDADRLKVYHATAPDSAAAIQAILKKVGG